MRQHATSLSVEGKPMPQFAMILCLMLLPAELPEQTSGRPDIVIILADDLGYSDIGCFGGEIKTPNLDALAAGGVRLREFYNTARCCPTRASLLTGLYSHQVGIGHMVDDRGLDGYRGELTHNAASIAEQMTAAGYSTYMSGKWHVTHNLGKAKAQIEPASRTNWPLDRGFERFYGTIHGAGSFFDPVTLARGNDYIEPEGDGYHYTDAISENAARFIKEHPEGDSPFLLYVAYTAPHWPLHAHDEDIARVQGRYREGWDMLREERLSRQRQMGLIEEEWALTPRDRRVKSWEEAPDKEWQERRMEVYAAQVEQMDRGIGNIVKALTEAGRLDNTLILFLADNGGCAEELSSRWGGTSIPDKTLDGRPVFRGNDPQRMPGPEETYQSYGVPWANASNTPFRLYKHHVHEGGIASPLVAHWPARLKEHGVILDGPGHVIDIVSTCLDVASSKPISHLDGRVMLPPEGISLLEILLGEAVSERAIFWEHEGNRAVRVGRWKLVSRHNQPWQLFDLETDRTELNDLAGQNPDLLQALIITYQQWAKRAGVAPWPPVPDRTLAR